MTDERADGTPPPPASETAGQLLRRAREARGLHVAALATTLKIPPRKLEALERDRYDELPDPAFTRALAQTACRALKIEPGPVLALLPRPDTAALDQVSSGLNTPFRDHQAGVEPSVGELLRAPAFWIVVVLVAAAVAVYFWPASVPVPVAPPAASAPAAAEPVMPPAAEPSASEPETATQSPTTAVSPSPPASVVDASAPPAAPPALLDIRTEAESWVQVTDARGRTLLSRSLAAGESVELDGELPLRVTVGNAGATVLRFRGVPVDLGAGTRDNVARLELR